MTKRALISVSLIMSHGTKDIALNLRQFFEEHPKVALGFSGGVDSSYLLYAARECGAKVHAYYVKSPFTPAFEYDDAMKVAQLVGVPPRVIVLDPLADPQVRVNGSKRCYFCKLGVFGAIRQAAAEDDAGLLIDGTNASDDPSQRPGTQALSELSIASPLALCGLTKAQVRELSRKAGLPTWNKPSYSCLATRIAQGEGLTYEKLERTEWAEGQLFARGYADFRMRTRGEGALLQVTAAQLPKAQAEVDELRALFTQRYASFELDGRARNESL